MKKTLQFLALSLILMLTSMPLYSQQGFNGVSSPDGINVIAVGDNGLLFRSSNGGNTWAGYSHTGNNFNGVCSYGDNVWIASVGGNVYKTFKTNSPIASKNVGTGSTLYGVYFVNNNIGFTCGDGGVVYKSVDGGNTWSSSNSGISSVDLNSISFSDASNGVVVGDGGVIYTTGNGGSSWTSLSSGTSKDLLSVEYFSNGFAIAGEYGTLLLKPNSQSLSSIDTKINSDIRGVSGTSMSDIHVCGGGGFVRNNKNGSSEFLNFETNPMMANLVDLHYYDANTGYAVSSLNQAIIKTTNGGQSWDLTAGANVSYKWEAKLPTSMVTGSSRGNNLSVHPKNRDAVFVALDNDVFASYDRGETWTDIADIPGSFPHNFYVSPLDTNVWVAAIVNSTDQVIRTTDYGQTWNVSIAKNFTNYGTPLEMDDSNPGVYYFAPDGGGFYKSTDNGATFNLISNFAFRSPCDIEDEYDNTDVLFVSDGVTSNGLADVFKSVNGGVNWVKVHTASRSEIPSMCNTQFDKNIIYTTEWTGQKLYKSTNRGDSFFTLINSTGSSGWASDVCHEDPTTVLTGAYGSKTFLSTNSGANFTTISVAGISGGNTTGGGQLFMGRDFVLDMRTRSVLKLKVTYSVLTSIHEIVLSGEVPSEYDLHQNYPNPFNPSTKIKYDVPVQGIVKLTVFDQLGREVVQLVNGRKNAGSYLVEFDGSNLASGIYLYKLETRDNTITKKMTLIK